jgi:hypothetical protein
MACALGVHAPLPEPEELELDELLLPELLPEVLPEVLPPDEPLLVLEPLPDVLPLEDPLLVPLPAPLELLALLPPPLPELLVPPLVPLLELPPLPLPVASRPASAPIPPEEDALASSPLETSLFPCAHAAATTHAAAKVRRALPPSAARLRTGDTSGTLRAVMPYDLRRGRSQRLARTGHFFRLFCG